MIFPRRIITAASVLLMAHVLVLAGHLVPDLAQGLVQAELRPPARRLVRSALLRVDAEDARSTLRPKKAR